MFVGFVLHESERVHSSHQDVAHFERAQAYAEHVVKNCAEIQGKEKSVKNDLTRAAGPSHFNTARRDTPRRLPETTGHMSSRAEPIGKTEEKKTCTVSCTIASLPRVKESRWQLQTGAKRRSARRRRRETTSRQTREQDSITKVTNEERKPSLRP